MCIGVYNASIGGSQNRVGADLVMSLFLVKAKSPLRIARLMLVVALTLLGITACGSTEKVRVPGITFDTSGWKHQALSESEEKWTDDNQDVITLTYGANNDPLLKNPQEGDLRKARSAELSEKGAGIIELDVLELGKQPAVRCIYKEKQDPVGVQYTGQLVLPQADGKLYSIVVMAPEGGMTGMREAVVMDKLLGAKEIKVNDKTGEISGWLSNPYNADDKSRLVRNKAEDPKYDAEFPDHPLSRTRSIMKRIEQSVQTGPPGELQSP